METGEMECGACVAFYQACFVRCYFDELRKDIRHRIHQECKACYRGKMLKLRSGKNHICLPYENNLKLAYEKYGLECMKEYATNEWIQETIDENFMWAIHEDHGYMEGEHNHVPGITSWILMRYYYENFWNIDVLVQKLEDNIAQHSKWADFDIDRKCDHCYDKRVYLTRLYHDYSYVQNKKSNLR